MDIEKLVYLDQTGVDENISALYGYAKKGERSYSFTNAVRKLRLSTIAGYRYNAKDLVAPFEYKGTSNNDLF